jgi:hypothetical protein
MPAQKSPTRERFLKDLQPLKEPGSLPPTYSRLVLAKLRKPAVLARIKDPKVLRKLADDKTAGVYFNQVVKGQSVDFEVLAVLEEVSREYLETKQPLAA